MNDYINKYRSILEQMMDGFIVYDAQANYVYINKKAGELMGVDPASMIGKNARSISGGEHPEFFQSFHIAMKEQRYLFTETHYAPADAWYESHFYPSQDEMIVVLKNITEQKKQLELLTAEKQFSETIINGLPGIFYVTGKERKLLRWNKNLEKILGYTPEELATLPSTQFVDASDHEFTASKREEIMNGGSADVTMTVRTKDGRLRSYFISGRKIRLEGQDCLIGMGVDFTEKREAETKFSDLVNSSSVGIYIIQSRKLVYVNPLFADIFGYTQEELINTTELGRIIHAEDVSVVDKKLQEREAGAMDSVHYQVRGKKKTGEIIWLNIFGATTIFNGRSALIGTMADITANKKNEHDLKERVKELNCLYRLSELTGRPENSIQDIMSKFADIIPDAYQFPDITCSRITFEGAVYPSKNFQSSPWRQDAKILSDKTEVGTIEVFYLEEKPREFEGPFLKEERMMLNSIADILGSASERLHAEKIIRESEEKYRYLFDNNPAIIIIWDLETLMVQEVSQQAIDQLGYSREEFLKMSALDLRPEEDRQNFREIATVLQSSSQMSGRSQWKYQKKNRELVNVDIYSHRIVYHGRTCVLAMSIDITEVVKYREGLEKMVIERTHELKEARDIAETATQTKSQFLANMSHEIRTPLNAVIGLTHLSLKTEMTPKQFDYLKKIQSSSESLLGIINDILDFSKIEAGKLSLEETEFDLETVFNKLADIITYKAHAKGLEIAFGIDLQVPTLLVGDPHRLQQILNNLCTNAVKFTHKGEVVVSAKLNEEIDGRVALEFEVRDTGIGMDEDQVSNLFLPFMQADNSISRKFGGTGLGLSIVKSLTEMMDGKVWVKSRTGKGSSFNFTVTLIKQKIQRHIPEPAVNLRGLHVLVVDDNKTSLRIIKEALESFSLEVTAMDTAADAVHFLKRRRHAVPVKLALIDWKMPVMDGLQLADVIQQDENLSGIRIMMMCASYANEELMKQIEAKGLHGMVVKPIKYSALHDTIMQALDERSVAVKHAPARGSLTQPSAIGLKILLAEDNEINQQVAFELLEASGYSVEIAPNGREAVSKIRDSGNPSRFDLVLMDLQMPLMDGYKATRAIKKLPGTASLPIIAMTADAMEGVREKCFEAGMVDFITKPINPGKMFTVIEKWIKGPARPKTESEERESRIGGTERQAFPEFSNIDTKAALERINGNVEVYRGLLRKFIASHKTFVDDVILAYAKGKPVVSRRMLHTLKGASSNLGMTELSKLSAAVEDQLIGKLSAVKIKKVMAPLKKELLTLQDSLRAYVTAVPDDVNAISMQEARPSLVELEGLLEKQDLKASKVFRRIGTIKGYEEQMQLLATAITNYEFDQARKILKGFMNGISREK